MLCNQFSSVFSWHILDKIALFLELRQFFYAIKKNSGIQADGFSEFSFFLTMIQINVIMTQLFIQFYLKFCL